MKKITHALILFLIFFSSVGHTSDNTSLEPAHSGPERNFEKISNAVVQIRTQYGYGTGTVFEKSGELYVLTADHVVSPRASETVFIRVIKGENQVVASVFFSNPDQDIAILHLSSPIEEVEPYSIKFSRKKNKVGERAGYCGFPNRPELACFSGRISQISEKYIHLHSYAFSGASGSLVISDKGHAVGILSAIEVGNFIGIPAALEDMVWVSPISEDIFKDL